MHRVFLDCSGDETTPLRIAGNTYHHLVNVLRFRVGDRFSGLSSDGNEHRFLIRKIDGRCKYLLAERQEEVPPAARPAGDIYLFPALLKASAFSGMLRKTTEAGVTHITPIMVRRSVARVENSRRIERKLDRWRAVLLDAIEQCGRQVPPHISRPVTLTEALAAEVPGAARYYLDQAGTAFAAHTLEQTSPAAALFVGPEGGFTEEEKSRCVAAGAVPVSLGPHTLRADTASVAACAVMTAIMHMRYGSRSGTVDE